MSRFVRLFLAVVSFTLGTAVARAGLTASPVAVDFGKARQEQVLKATVTLTNPGTEPVEILRVGADCSCTAGAPKQMKLAPGESTTMEVAFETRTYQGLTPRRVVVQTTGGDLVVPVQALISAYDNWVFGAQLAMLPASNRGEPAIASFVIEYTGAGSAEITGFQPSVPWLKADIASVDGGKFNVRLSKDPKAPAGTHQPRVKVRTSDPREPELNFSVFASIQSQLSVDPTPVLLPETKVGERVSLPVSLLGWTPEKDPRGELDGGEVVLEGRDGTQALLQVSITPTTAGHATRYLRLYAGDELEAEVPVIIRAEKP